MIKVKYTGEYNEDGTPVRQIGPDDRQIISMDQSLQEVSAHALPIKGLT